MQGRNSLSRLTRSQRMKLTKKAKILKFLRVFDGFWFLSRFKIWFTFAVKVEVFQNYALDTMVTKKTIIVLRAAENESKLKDIDYRVACECCVRLLRADVACECCVRMLRAKVRAKKKIERTVLIFKTWRRYDSTALWSTDIETSWNVPRIRLLWP